MAFNKASIPTPKPQQNSRYVRILYLKEVKKPRLYEDQDEPFSDKKSLAYLSSLIQDERKGNIQTATPLGRLSRPIQTNFITNPPVINRRTSRLKSLYEISNGQAKHADSKTKQNSLTEILGNEPFSESSQQLNLRRKIIPQLQMKRVSNQLKEQFEKDFMGFCIDVKQAGRKYPQKCLKPSRKTALDLNHFEEQPLSLNKSVAVQQQQYRQRRPTMVSKTQEVDRYRLKRNIIYRKNFREMDNFGWAKIANRDFNLES